MAFYTPRGLKIRLSLPYAFTLLSRLYPKRTPEKVLLSTEAVDGLSVLNWDVMTLLAIWYQAPFWAVTAIGIGASVAGTLTLWFGIFLIPGLPTLSLWWSFIPTFFRLIGLLLAAYAFQGWDGVLSLVVAYGASFLANKALELKLVRSRYLRSGVLMTSSEVSFLQAYRLHAVDLGVTTDINVTQEEMTSAPWREVVLDYASDHMDRVPAQDLERVYKQVASAGRADQGHIGYVPS